MFTFDSTIIIFIIEIAALSAILTGFAVYAARRLRLLAHPVERSSHKIPTPQVGGLGISLALLAPIFILAHNIGPEFLTPDDPTGGLIRSLAAIILIGMLLGLIDDIRPLNALTKLAGLCILAAVPVFYQISLTTLSIPGILHVTLGLWIGGALAFCWIVFFVNAFNFMDGANGQSGVFTINAIIWMALITPPGNYGLMPWLFAAVAGAILGFLPWNFPRAKTFMGDCGSLPIGAILATLALFNAQGSVSSFIGVSLVLSPYIYDVIYTLIRRIRRGENLFTAHRSHLYQRLLIATNWSHARLLAFHLPWYILTGASALIYHSATGPVARGGVVVAVFAILVGYTLFVLRAENAKARRESSAG